MSTATVLFRQIDGHTIGQRKSDGYVNATALCKAAGKLWAHYHANATTEEFLQELEPLSEFR